MKACLTDRPEKIADFILVMFFFCVISLPSVLYLSGASGQESVHEKRPLRQMLSGEMDYWSLVGFPRVFEGYFDDHIGLRGPMIRAYNRIKIGLLRDSPTRSVVLGKDGWLFYDGAAREDGDTVADHRRKPLDESSVLGWQRVMGGRAAWLGKRGIRFVLVVAPNKQTVYPRYMPDSFTSVGASSPMDQVMGCLKAIPNLYLVDPRESLRTASLSQQVYDRTDGHWNQRGAFIAYRSVMDLVSEWFPAAAPHGIGDYDIICRDEQGGDLACSLAIPDILIERSRPVFVPRYAPAARSPALTPSEQQTWTVDNPALPSAVVFRDSSAYAMAPFLSEHFRKILYTVSSARLDVSKIRDEHPDIVMMIISERYLRDVPPDQPLPSGDD